MKVPVRRQSGKTVSCVLILTAATIVRAQVTADNWDRFNYRRTVSTLLHNDYGPEDWSKIRCPDPNLCLGWADTFENSQGWDIDSVNHCKWCPATGNTCGVHHSSPINLERNRAVVGHPEYNECIDGHWMAYFDSSCSFNELRAKNAFTIERHGLKITQPMSTIISDDTYPGVMAIDCVEQLGKRAWGRIDFAKGFSDWWLLSHIDFHVPSEHTQEGKRYSAELQMFHFFSTSGEVTGKFNEMGTVSIFMEAYDDDADWPELNKIICAWRETEEKNRAACGLPSVRTQYAGCSTYTRGRMKPRKLQSLMNDTKAPTYEPAISAYDILLENLLLVSTENSTHQLKKIDIGSLSDYPVEEFDWDKFISKHYAEEEHRKRNLLSSLNYDDVPWFNYFPMLAVKTEYYYRYSGTQTTPPCYGTFIQGPENRKQTNHWRVMKDPVKVSQRQIDEMHRLIRARIAPRGDPIRSCQPDTAAKKESNKINVARPLQSTHKAHYEVFCECIDWKSKFVEDQNWCAAYKNDQNARFYQHPYNFYTDGF